MSLNIRFAKALVVGSVLTLAACGGAPNENEKLQERLANSGGSGNSGTGGSGGSGSSGGIAQPSITYLDCDNLDPDQVYIHGQLDIGFLVGTDILFAPSDPNTFCVGFAQNIRDGGYVSSTGNYVWLNDSDILQLVQDDLEWDSTDGTWIYPSTPENDDIELATQSFDPSDLFMTLDDQIYTRDRSGSNAGSIYVGSNTAVYHSRASSDRMLGVRNDGSILFGNNSGLFILNPDFTETALTNPSGTVTGLDYNRRMRHFSDSTTGNASAWVYVVYSDDTEHRWSVDFVTEQVTDDGVISALPAGVELTNILMEEAVFDAAGALWQQGIGTDASSNSFNVVVKRPLDSEAASTVEYSEEDYLGGADWTEELSPYGHINHNGPLVTGP